ncbi:UDP-N-acetylmuramoyl-tripeptide--D-alanyl-D-alanine ligase [Sulfuriferula thiophila]|uniref:UDP-N-acetylmuramoyl-tripeptide--D-alanyl-D- alanine ligase n=1 Tax=Sulfuriferula thiophila TaxID=1781211 RepID=UPI00278BE83B|nr:UDP-N-acetylmuramoyl-tripeptide--D-alanyl-D-alanine ligase [Sulfuriferula thiophila]
MSMMTLNVAAQAIAAKARGAAEFTRVTTDSRDIQPGDLFVALRGEKFDGHQFAQAALDAGAAAVMVDNQCVAELSPALVVADTRLALGQLAAYWRKQMPARIIGVTGSSGKTSVKEMLAAILHAAVGDEAVLATKGNFNNDIGMPLTLLRLQPQHQYGVIEMGMNHAGEIAYLTRLAQPDVALINNAGTAHIGMLGSVEAIAAAKGEILLGLPTDGVAIINADDVFAPLWRQSAGTRAVMDFGLQRATIVCGSYVAHAAYSDVHINSPIMQLDLQLPVLGEHSVMNALAAAAAAMALGINGEAIVTGLQGFKGVYGRLQRKPARQGAIVIDDSYNANPDSTRAAIQVLAAVAGTRLLVLGDMGELGTDEVALHAEIGALAKSAGIDGLYALGELSRHAVAVFGNGAQHFANVEELTAALLPKLMANVTVLVKGSRFMQMERVVKVLEEQA